MKKLIIDNPETAIKLTSDQAEMLGIDTSQDTNTGELKTCGPWNTPVSFKALCVSATFVKKMYDKKVQEVIYGKRTMTNVRQEGYSLEGYVSVGGKKYSCFTSSQLFEINGKLIDVAVIYARVK